MRTTLSMALIVAVAGCDSGDGTTPAAPSSPPAPAHRLSPRSALPQIVFTGPEVAASTGVQEVVVGQADRTGLQQLTTDGSRKFLPHFSPDGRTILYTKFTSAGYGSPGARAEIAVFDLGTARERVLTRGGTWVQGVWSPDGRMVAYGTLSSDSIWLMNADGSGQRRLARSSGKPDDQQWGDFLWSSDNWIYFSVAQRVNGCFKVRMDRMRPDGSNRTMITDGGRNCTPAGLEQSGDADPGVSPDGRYLYSSRGLPRTVPGHPELTVRHLYRIETTPWTPDKPETDLSVGATVDCITGVPKVSPDNSRIALFLFCPSDLPHLGVHITDLSGSRYRFVARGFGPDWNPAIR